MLLQWWCDGGEGPAQVLHLPAVSTQPWSGVQPLSPLSRISFKMLGLNLVFLLSFSSSILAVTVG